MDTKSVHPAEVKFDDEAGTVVAKFATLNVKDSDGDVTLPGFFGEQKTAIAWAHDRSRVVGKGAIRESGDVAIFEGKFFLDTYEGEQAYLTTKAMGDLQEWSYGFHLKQDGFEFGQHDGDRVRFLKATDAGEPGAKVAEVSPVLVGAGVGTATVGIKSQGMRFVDHAESVAKEAELLYARAEEVSALRAEKGKTIGEDTVAVLRKVATRLESVSTMLSGLTQNTNGETSDGSLIGLDIERTLAASRALTRR